MATVLQYQTPFTPRAPAARPKAASSGMVALSNTIITSFSNTSRVLHFGCGCGLLGEKLRAAGFTDLTGLDYNQSLVQLVKGEGVFNEVYSGRGVEEIQDDEPYDVVVTSETYLLLNNTDCIQGLIRLVKSGGALVIYTKHEYCVMDFSKWETLQHLVSQGRIEQVKGGNVVQFKPTCALLQDLRQGWTEEVKGGETVVHFKMTNMIRKD